MQEKLEAVEKAISDLQSGKRVASVKYGDTQVQYAAVDLEELLNLRMKIQAALNMDTRRQMVFSTSKGLK